MTPTPHAREVLRRLVEALVDVPELLVVEILDGEGWAEYVVRDAAANDKGKLLGGGGTFARAVGVVAKAMGERAGERWKYRCEFEDEHARRGPKPPQARRPEKHDAAHDVSLLIAVVEACIGEGIELLVDGGDMPGDSWVTLFPKSRPATALLTDPLTVGTRKPVQTTLLAEIGTVFRAIGLRQGVVYKVTLSS